MAGRTAALALGAHVRTPIAVDIGKRHIRAVQLAGPRRGPWLPGRCYVVGWQLLYRKRPPQTNGGEPATPEGNGTSPEAPSPEDAFLASDLRRLTRRGMFRGRAVITDVEPPDVEIHALSLPLEGPRVRGAQWENMLRFELDRHVSGEIEHMEVRSWPLPRANATAPNVMALAAPREAVARRVEWFHRAGLECVRVDAALCAVIRGAAAVIQPQADTIWAALDLGHGVCRVAVAVGATPLLHRTIDAGADVLAARLSERLGISASSAHRLLLDIGIDTEATTRPAIAHPQLVDPRQSASLILAAVRLQLDALAREVERALAYAMHVYSDAQVHGLLLSGGLAAMPGLAAYLAESIGVPVTVADPFRAVPLAPGVPAPPGASPAWLRAVGLALGHAMAHPPQETSRP